MQVSEESKSYLTALSCSKCGKKVPAHTIQRFSACCNKPLLAEYSTPPTEFKTSLPGRVNSMWRYAEMLPLQHGKNRVSLGEGMTPILDWRNLASRYSINRIWVKDEGLNPSGSFKARGISMALSRAVELGIEKVVIPTAGNAGGALSAYSAVAGIECTVVMPRDTPRVFMEECELHGAKLLLVDGLIDQCGKTAAGIEAQTGAFNMATMKEPYRLEGKKTMGYEIAEQLNWKLPDTIIYPTGGGTGLIGIWKAFAEMRKMAWLPDGKLPRMISVQAAVCSPLTDRMKGRDIPPEGYAMSIANGLSVPHAFGEDLIMQVIRESRGLFVTVSEQEIRAGITEIAASEGMIISPEGAAVWEGLKKLVKSGQVGAEESVLLLNTGNGFKYMDDYRQ